MSKPKHNRPTRLHNLRREDAFTQFLLNESKRPGFIGSDARLLVSKFQGRTESGLRGEIKHFAVAEEPEEWGERLQRVVDAYHMRCQSLAEGEHARNDWMPLRSGGFMRKDHRGENE